MNAEGLIYTDVFSETHEYAVCPRCGKHTEFEHVYGQRVMCACGLRGELDCRGRGVCRVAWTMPKGEEASDNGVSA